jgi:sporulation protein YlmC with PRC-barrel domain
MGGNQLGTVQDLVLDFDQTMVTYVIVDANGSTVVVPWSVLSMPTAGGTGTGGTGSTGTTATDTPSASTGTTATDTPSAGTGTTATDTPAAGTVATATSETSSGTGSSTTGTQGCLTLTVEDSMFTNAPAVDLTTMLPPKGQPATGWDATLMDYWIGGGTGTTATDTPSASTGTIATDTPSAGSGTTATDTPSAGTSATATPVAAATATSSAGTGAGTGTGTQQLQGVMLATDVLGATVTVSGSTSGTGGTGTTATDTPSAGTGTTATDTPSAGGTSATSTPEAGGTGTGDFSQGTIEDVIIDPATGDIQYAVVQFGSQDTWVPIPVNLLGWDSATNSFVLMVSPDTLQTAPSFPADQFPDTSTPGWDQEWSTFWQNNGGTGTGSGTGTGGTTISTATATP